MDVESFATLNQYSPRGCYAILLFVWGYSFRAAFLLDDDREMGAGVAEFKGCSRIASTRAALSTSATITRTWHWKYDLLTCDF